MTIPWDVCYNTAGSMVWEVSQGDWWLCTMGEDGHQLVDRSTEPTTRTRES